MDIAAQKPQTKHPSKLLDRMRNLAEQSHVTPFKAAHFSCAAR